MKEEKEPIKGQNDCGEFDKKFTRVEAAGYLRISIVSIDRAIARKKISFFRIGRRVVFGRQHLEEFLKRNECTATVRGGMKTYA